LCLAVLLCLYCSWIVGQQCEQEEADDMGPSTSCSSPDEMSYYGDEWSYPLDLTDEHALDGEVGKRLNQMVPVPVSIE
jgi:hypothetical protein